MSNVEVADNESSTPIPYTVMHTLPPTTNFTPNNIVKMMILLFCINYEENDSVLSRFDPSCTACMPGELHRQFT